MIGDWKRMLNAVSPWLGAAVSSGLPALLGMSAAHVGRVLDTAVMPTEESILHAINAASHDQLTALKEADSELGVKLRELGFSSLQALRQLTPREREQTPRPAVIMLQITPSLISFMIIILFAYVLHLFLTEQLPEQSAFRESILILIGTLTASFGQVVSYFLGSSFGNNKTTTTIERPGKQ